MITTAPNDKLHVILTPARISKLAKLADNDGTSTASLAAKLLGDSIESAWASITPKSKKAPARTRMEVGA